MKLSKPTLAELKSAFEAWKESVPSDNSLEFYTDGLTLFRGHDPILFPSEGSGGLQLDSKAPDELAKLMAENNFGFDVIYMSHHS